MVLNSSFMVFVLLFCGGVVVYILCTFTIIHD
nr:MAG TPA: hypothetical protein [Caudoviricetes sp.]